MSIASALAFNAVAPAIARWNDQHLIAGAEPYWLPLSARQAIADAILAELAQAGLLRDAPVTPRTFQDAPD